MPSSHPSSIPALNRRPRSSEDGFGLLELIVVLVIVAILLAIAVGSFRGTKRTTHFKSAQSAATSYAEAVEAYMQDNGQRVPKPGGAEWPELANGPVNSMLKPSARGYNYMPHKGPEAVQGGSVAFVSGSLSTAKPGITPQATIQYTGSGSAYTFTVRATGSSSDTVLECVVTNDPANTAKRCD
jgi:prepilin-type N-terminal cleavage/methylation domain-containing protein